MKAKRIPHEKEREHSSRVAATAKAPKQQMGLKHSKGWGNTAKAVEDIGRKQSPWIVSHFCMARAFGANSTDTWVKG